MDTLQSHIRADVLSPLNRLFDHAIPQHAAYLHIVIATFWAVCTVCILVELAIMCKCAVRDSCRRAPAPRRSTRTRKSPQRFNAT